MANLPQNRDRIEIERAIFRRVLPQYGFHDRNQCVAMCIAHDIQDAVWVEILSKSLESGNLELPEPMKQIAQREYTNLPRAEQIDLLVEKNTIVGYADYFEQVKDVLQNPIAVEIDVPVVANAKRMVVALSGYHTDAEQVIIVFADQLWSTERPFFAYDGFVYDRPEGILIVLSHGSNDVTSLNGEFFTVSVYKKPNVRELEDRLYGIKALRTDPAIQEKMFPLEKFGVNVAHELVELREGAVLDQTQRRAVTEMVHCDPRHSFILFGPPGTGKTTTGVEAIASMLSMNKNYKILVCAQTNKACDNIATLLVQSGALDVDVVHRIYARNFDPATASQEIRQITSVENGYFVLPNDLHKFRVIICTIGSTLSLQRLGNGFFSHIMFEEASQIHELDVFRPLAMFCNRRTVLLFSGDPEQLSPYVLGNGLLKLGYAPVMPTIVRLSRHAFYRESVHYMVMLDANYRSNRFIARIFNVLTYNGQLAYRYTEPLQTTRQMSQIVDHQRVPVRWHICFGDEFRNPENGSVSNAAEIVVILRYVHLALGAGLQPSDIGIVTPYRAQVELINQELAAAYPGVTGFVVETVEGFQGRGAKMLLFSLVRNKNLGFLQQHRRLNTAISRAKNLLIIIGNPFTLLQNGLGGYKSYAMRLLRFFKQEHLFHQDVVVAPPYQDYRCWINAIEAAIPEVPPYYRIRGDGTGQDEDRYLAFRTFLR